MVTRYDFINLKAMVSDEGWIKDRPVITRTGIFEYRTTTGKIHRELRTNDEVFNADSLNSVTGIPITIGHVGILTATNHKGVIGAVISPGIKQDDNVVADVIIHDATKLGDKRALSLGYVCDLEETPGVTDSGERYDAIQKNIKYNHLAVVTNGRAGNARLRLDSTDAVSGLFDREDVMDTAKMVTIRLDGIEYAGSPEVAHKLTKYETDLVELKRKYDTTEAERDSFKAKLEEEKEKAIQAASASMEAARARIKLEDMAATAGVTFDDTKSDRIIKEAIVNKLRANTFKFDGKSDDYVDSAYDLIVSEKKDTVAEQRKKLNERADEIDTSKQSANAARDRMMARIRGEKEAA